MKAKLHFRFFLMPYYDCAYIQVSMCNERILMYCTCDVTSKPYMQIWTAVFFLFFIKCFFYFFNIFIEPFVMLERLQQQWHEKVGSTQNLTFFKRLLKCDSSLQRICFNSSKVQCQCALDHINHYWASLCKVPCWGEGSYMHKESREPGVLPSVIYFLCREALEEVGD